MEQSQGRDEQPQNDDTNSTSDGQATLADGQTMPVHPANLAAAKDALAARKASERAVAESDGSSDTPNAIDPEDFRSVAPLDPPSDDLEHDD